MKANLRNVWTTNFIVILAFSCSVNVLTSSLPFLLWIISLQDSSVYARFSQTVSSTVLDNSITKVIAKTILLSHVIFLSTVTWSFCSTAVGDLRPDGPNLVPVQWFIYDFWMWSRFWSLQCTRPIYCYWAQMSEYFTVSNRKQWSNKDDAICINQSIHAKNLEYRESFFRWFGFLKLNTIRKDFL